MQPAKQSHGYVSVAIDESGQDQLSFSVDRLSSCVPGFDFAARADGDDRVSSYGNSSVIDDGA